MSINWTNVVNVAGQKLLVFARGVMDVISRFQALIGLLGIAFTIHYGITGSYTVTDGVRSIDRNIVLKSDELSTKIEESNKALGIELGTKIEESNAELGTKIVTELGTKIEESNAELGTKIVTELGTKIEESTTALSTKIEESNAELGTKIVTELGTKIEESNAELGTKIVTELGTKMEESNNKVVDAIVNLGAIMQNNNDNGITEPKNKPGNEKKENQPTKLIDDTPDTTNGSKNQSQKSEKIEDHMIVSGLDTKHAAFLQNLIERNYWTPDDFEELAQRHGLVPVVAVKTINDWIAEKYKEQLLDEQDGYYLAPDIASLLISDFNSQN